MTDAKQEALRQALHYHNTLTPAVIAGHKEFKKPTPEQIVATAAKFEKFLEGKRKD